MRLYITSQVIQQLIQDLDHCLKLHVSHRRKKKVSFFKKKMFIATGDRHVQVNQIACIDSLKNQSPFFATLQFLVRSTLSDGKPSSRDFTLVPAKAWTRRAWQDNKRTSTAESLNDSSTRDFNFLLLASLFQIFSITGITNEQFF